MKKSITRKLALVMAVVMMLTMAFASTGLTASGLSYYGGASGRYGLLPPKVYAESYFFKGEAKISNKAIKQCYARLQEGTYDSGRVYNHSTNKNSVGQLFASVSKNNQIGKTAYGNWGFIT